MGSSVVFCPVLKLRSKSPKLNHNLIISQKILQRRVPSTLFTIITGRGIHVVVMLHARLEGIGLLVVVVVQCLHP